MRKYVDARRAWYGVLFGALACIGLSCSVAGSVKPMFGRWVSVNSLTSRISISQNGDVYEVKFYNRDRLESQVPASYKDGILTCRGAMTATFYYDKKSGQLVGNAWGSAHYKRITAAIAKQLAADDARYYRQIAEQQRKAKEEQRKREAEKQQAEDKFLLLGYVVILNHVHFIP